MIERATFDLPKLAELDRQHDELLDHLDALDDRINQILGSHRKAASEQASETGAEHETQHDILTLAFVGDTRVPGKSERAA